MPRRDRKAQISTLEKRLEDEIRRYTLKGDYAGALPVVRDYLKKEPDSVFVLFQYAKILGDWADELPLARKKKYKRESIRILAPLRKRLSGLPAPTRFSICLNYYYQCEDFSGMRRMGKRLILRKNPKGYYALGIASTYLARLRPEGQLRSSLLQEALSAWRCYGLKNEKYYFPHYVCALAHALAGNKTLALVSLRNAARLSRRTLHDWEFKDVLSELKKLS